MMMVMKIFFYNSYKPKQSLAILWFVFLLLEILKIL